MVQAVGLFPTQGAQRGRATVVVAAPALSSRLALAGRTLLPTSVPSGADGRKSPSSGLSRDELGSRLSISVRYHPSSQLFTVFSRSALAIARQMFLPSSGTSRWRSAAASRVTVSARSFPPTPQWERSGDLLGEDPTISSGALESSSTATPSGKVCTAGPARMRMCFSPARIPSLPGIWSGDV